MKKILIIIALLFVSLISYGQNYREFPAHVVSIYDGDTYTLDIDLGFRMTYNSSIRLYNLDCPELRGTERPDGLAVRDSVIAMILDKPILIQLVKERGKYGRPIVIVYREEDMLNINDWLVSKGLCEFKEY